MSAMHREARPCSRVALRTVEVIDLEIQIRRDVFWYWVRVHVNSNDLRCPVGQQDDGNFRRVPNQMTTTPLPPFSALGQPPR